MWCIGKLDAEYIARMEDVLSLYEQAYDPAYPVICFDELSKQLIQETRQPIPAGRGQLERYDYEYQRKGTANLFVSFEPKAGKRFIEVTARRTKRDYAKQMQALVERYPDAKKIRVVHDNLNTHKPASLYETFAPQEARRILDKLEFHYTPKHASWLNMAEIEINVLTQQCLDRRIPARDLLEAEVAAYQKQRNDAEASVAWQFTCEDARAKLARHYPSLES